MAVSAALSAAPWAASAGPAFGDVERRLTAAGAPVALQNDPTRASVAVCVATEPASPGTLADARTLAAHGVTEHDDERSGVSVACLSSAPDELAFSLDVVKRRLASDDEGRPPPDTATLARALALEGSDPPEAPRGHAVAVAGAVGPEPWTVVERALGATRPAKDGAPAPWTLHQTTERLTVLDVDRDAPGVDYVWAVPEATPVEMASLRIGFELLAGEGGGRLHALLVKRGLARRTELLLSGGEGGALYGVRVDASTKGPLDRIRRFVDGALKQTRLVGPSTVDVRRTAARLRLRALEAWDDVEERSRRLALAELVHGDARAAFANVDAFARVTPETVRRTMHDAVVDSRRATVETYPKTWPEDDPAHAAHRLHTVLPGETLADIAARYQVDPTRLARENDVDPRYRLTVGEPLWIPPK